MSFQIILGVIASILDRAVFDRNNGAFSVVVGLALLLPSLAVAVRRLHDSGRTGWWLLIGLIPVIGTIVLIIFYVQDSQGDNKYGPSPKGVSAGGAPPVTA
jgi:uncharacterized membrane protein YhaH (DUF805 family)